MNSSRMVCGELAKKWFRARRRALRTRSAAAVAAGRRQILRRRQAQQIAEFFLGVDDLFRPIEFLEKLGVLQFESPGDQLRADKRTRTRLLKSRVPISPCRFVGTAALTLIYPGPM
jgi:hypothetical protein